MIARKKKNDKHKRRLEGLRQLQEWRDIQKNPVKDVSELPEPFRQRWYIISTEIFDAMAFMGVSSEGYVEILSEKLTGVLIENEILKKCLKE